MRYNIVKLNAKKILDYATITENTNPTNKNKEFDVQFKLDGEMFKSAISITEPIDDNAAFYQLRRIVKEEKEGIVSDDNILIDKILYLDFSGVSFDIVNESNNMIKRENLKKNIKLNETQKSYYLFLNGFTVIYSEKKNVDYKAFDKSGSMSRASIISFISIQFFEGMEESAKLGMDLDSVILSKYLAYRGLMFSGGQRIIQCESFLLNEKTVIVVEEKIINKKCTSAITASKNYSSTFNIDKLENCDIEIKMFDGEGLVSFEYAREIVRQLYKNEIDSIKKKIHHYLGTNLGEEFFKILETAAYPKKSLTQVDLINALPKLADKAGSSDKFVSLEDQTTKELLMSYMIFFNKMPTSFQIRLPFVKGMLHVVEFRSYLKNLSVVKIEDYYKIDRALDEIQVILTESMFKACSWLKNSFDNNVQDPMAFYFKKNREYDHTIYITNINRRSLSGLTKLNYQFLSTANIKYKDFKKIEDKGLAFCTLLKTDKTTQLKHFGVEANDENETEPSDEVFSSIRAKNKYQKILEINDHFLKEPRIKRMINTAVNASFDDFSVGRIAVEGEIRFLSSDLLQLLNWLGQKSGKNDSSRQADKYIFKNYFFAPAASSNWNNNKTYAIMRNPHLSRNEVVSLKPCFDETFDTWFGHLTGIVMVNPQSFVPMTLGGADYDGDLVKIIKDREFCNAAEKCYYPVSSNNTSQSERARQHPIILIPSLSGKDCKLNEDISKEHYFNTIKNTFSSRIGLICNSALRYALDAYNENANTGTKDESRKMVERLAVLSGLEIDAAKTGVHPMLDDVVSTKRCYFIEYKNNHKKITSKRRIKLTGADLSTGNNKRENNLVEVKKVNDDSHNIEHLPYDGMSARFNFVDDDKAKPINETDVDDSVNSCISVESDSQQYYFKFQQYENQYEEQEKQKTLKKLSAIMVAYKKIKNRIKYQQWVQECFQNKSYRGYINTILDLQYDSRDDFDSTVTDINIAFHEALKGSPNDTENGQSNSSTQTTQIKKLNGMLKKLIEEKWHMTPKNERYNKLDDLIRDLGVILEDKQKSLLTNFSQGGYKLLNLIVRDTLVDIYADIEIDVDTASRIQKESDDNTKKQKNKNTGNGSVSETESQPKPPIYIVDLDATTYDDVVKTLMTEYLDKTKYKVSPSLYRKAARDICYAKTFSLFSGNMDEALKNVYYLSNKIDKSHSFLWDIFKDDEIIRNVYVKKGNKDVGETTYAE